MATARGPTLVWRVGLTAAFLTSVALTLGATRPALACNAANVVVLRTLLKPDPVDRAGGTVAATSGVTGLTPECAQTVRARVATVEGDDQEAGSQWELLAAADPGDRVAAYFAGEADRHLGNIGATIRFWDEAWNVPGLLAIESDCRQLLNLPCTQGAGEAVIQLDPAQLNAYLDIGATYAETGDPGTGRQWFARAGEIAPTSPFPTMLTAWSYANEGNTLLAETWYLRAISEAPLEARPHYEYGLLLWSEGRWGEAVQQFNGVLATQSAADFAPQITALYCRQNLTCAPPS